MHELRGRITVDRLLVDFIEREVLPGTDIGAPAFWAGLDALIAEFEPRNRALLEERDRLQALIDNWHFDNRAGGFDMARYEAFLGSIGYFFAEPDPFKVDVEGIDPEISAAPGPQLVVPVTSARYAINAANARWGSLYDAVYGTDAIAPKLDETAADRRDEARARLTVERVKAFLDRSVPLAAGRHANVVSYRVTPSGLECVLAGGTVTHLSKPRAFAGYRGQAASPSHILLRNHGLHIDLVFDRQSPVGRLDAAGMSDVVLESALTTIVDFEDSVATVDVEDKIPAYRNWLGLMKGTLSATLRKNGREVKRELAEDRDFLDAEGKAFVLRGRSLLLVRNVGQHTTTEMVSTYDGHLASEALVDAMVTTLIGLHDLRGARRGMNSRAGSIYVVKPKMHSPDEVQLAVDLFDRIERLFRLPANTIKIGIMDEERRMSANLQAALYAARHRVFFINTGFLDRTGDEIHSIMEAGPVVPKSAFKSQKWLRAYEDRNVVTGLRAGLDRRGQIGKGMWTATDRMADMIAQKGAHLTAGASTSWVPSPTAAVLHAMHYHVADVRDRQSKLRSELLPPMADLLSLAVAEPGSLDRDVVMRDLDSNVQSLLGYVVRWIDQGIGCSKVPDIDGVDRMEDRATLRISSQHIANWLLHDVISISDVENSLRRMAVLVDAQNSGDPKYEPMAPKFDGPAFRTAQALIFDGRAQPNGYTEYLLNAGRLERKAARR